MRWGSTKSFVSAISRAASAVRPLSGSNRSGEGRVGEEGRYRGWPDYLKKKELEDAYLLLRRFKAVTHNARPSLQNYLRFMHMLLRTMHNCLHDENERVYPFKLRHVTLTN